MPVHRTSKQIRSEPADAASLERGVRQLLAYKVSGTMVGLWLLAAEHLRLGTWDLLCGWTQRPGSEVEPRLALQLVHEAALCLSGVRQQRTLNHKGFELANGLPFVATDQAMHTLLAAQTVANCQQLQIALGRLRRASGHFQGRLLALDPHPLRSYSQRQMRMRCAHPNQPALKTLRCFFCFDVETQQPLAFTLGSGARTVAQATPELLSMSQQILQPAVGQTLLLADAEHYVRELFAVLQSDSPFDLLCPMPNQPARQRHLQQLPAQCFQPRWAGLATARLPFGFSPSDGQPFYELVQRCGECPNDYRYKSFLSTCARQELDQICYDYPQRWHLEEFFNAYQAMGWNRGGTLNLNIRYAQLTMALLAQAVVHQLRQRLGPPYQHWEAGHLGRHLFQGLDGDIRVEHDTVLVTFYNAPNADQLRRHYENLPAQLAHHNIDPRLPWLYNFNLDFRFN